MDLIHTLFNFQVLARDIQEGTDLYMHILMCTNAKKIIESFGLEKTFKHQKYNHISSTVIIISKPYSHMPHPHTF